MILWIILLVLMALCFLVYPFLVGAGQSVASVDEKKTRKNTNIRLFKEQQAQLEQQQTRGEIDSDQYHRLVVDAEELLLANTDLDPIIGSNIAGNGLWLLPVLLIGAFAATWAIYDDIGAAEDEKVATLINQIASLDAQTTGILELNQELIQAIRKVYRGETFVTNQVMREINKTPSNDEAAINKLTPREFQVFSLLAEGRTAVEIGHDMNLSHKTIHSHRSNIMKKLKLETSFSIVQFAILQGIVKN